MAQPARHERSAYPDRSLQPAHCVGAPARLSKIAAPARASSRQSWLLLSAAFLTFAVGAACMHSYTVFLIAFIEAFGWTRGEASIAYSVSQMVGGATSPLVGVLVDRLGPRRMVLLGGVLLSAGLLCSATAHALWQVVLLYGVVMTLGANCLGLVVFVPVLSRRFVRRRGMAVAIVQSANGFARAVSAPLSQVMISGLGWRGAYLAQGGFMAVAFLPLALLFRRNEPERIGVARRALGRRAMAGRCARRCARRISGCCRWSMYSPAWAASWWRCTSWPSR